MLRRYSPMLIVSAALFSMLTAVLTEPCFNLNSMEVLEDADDLIPYTSAKTYSFIKLV